MSAWCAVRVRNLCAEMTVAFVCVIGWLSPTGTTWAARRVMHASVIIIVAYSPDGGEFTGCTGSGQLSPTIDCNPGLSSRWTDTCFAHMII
jgi:hypothetical protein